MTGQSPQRRPGHTSAEASRGRKSFLLQYLHCLKLKLFCPRSFLLFIYLFSSSPSLNRKKQQKNICGYWMQITQPLKYQPAQAAMLFDVSRSTVYDCNLHTLKIIYVDLTRHVLSYIAIFELQDWKILVTSLHDQGYSTHASDPTFLGHIWPIVSVFYLPSDLAFSHFFLNRTQDH